MQLTVCRVCILRNRKPRLQQAAIYITADQHEISFRLTGQRRIIAVGERKLRLRPGEPVRLTADDVQIRR
jgi:hypothetical protein